MVDVTPTPAVDAAPIEIEVAPTPVTYTVVRANPELESLLATVIELPTETPLTSFTKIWVEPTSTVDVNVVFDIRMSLCVTGVIVAIPTVYPVDWIVSAVNVDADPTTP